MIVPLIAVLLAVQVPQESALDVPIYVDTTFGVSIGQPADTWVFEPSRGRGTTTILFSPRGASLRDQLWGALVLTTFNRDVPLDRVADQRIASTWQNTLGPGFTVLARDSISLRGLPTVHLVMTGEVDQVAFDVEEYLIARGEDLILLQFRYPRALPRATLAAGYERALAGMRIRGAPDSLAARVEPPPSAPVSPVRQVPAVTPQWRALAGSVWHAGRVDATVRLPSAGRPLEIEARIDLTNQGFRPLAVLPLWLPPGAVAESVRVGGEPSRPAGAGALTIELADAVAPDGRVSVSVFYLLASRDADPRVGDWLPLWAPTADSVGVPAAFSALAMRVRFDVPEGYEVVATGRRTSTLAAAGRARSLWTAEAVVPDQAAFIIGRFTPAPRRVGRLEVKLWVSNNAPPLPPPTLDTLAETVARGWAFYSRAFGDVGEPVVNVTVGAGRSTGAAAVVFLAGSDVADRDIVLRELARTWWGGAVRGIGEGAALIDTGFPAWSAVAARGVLEGDSVRQRLVRAAEAVLAQAQDREVDRPLAGDDAAGVARPARYRAKSTVAIEAARRAAGEARFREAVKTLAMEHRGRSARAADVIAVLGPAGAAALMPYLYGPD